MKAIWRRKFVIPIYHFNVQFPTLSNKFKPFFLLKTNTIMGLIIASWLENIFQIAGSVFFVNRKEFPLFWSLSILPPWVAAMNKDFQNMNKNKAMSSLKSYNKSQIKNKNIDRRRALFMSWDSFVVRMNKASIFVSIWLLW